MYADYNFYTSEYMGSAIPDTVYAEAAREADAYIDYLTHNRIVLDDLPEAFQRKVKMAACAVAEICYKQTQDESSTTVSSESVGNHSKTFSVVKRGFEQREHEKVTKAKTYLHGTGLMYGGLR